MIVRAANKEDMPKVLELAKSYNLSIPEDGIIVLVEDEDKDVKAFMNIRIIPYVEPMISKSPFASQVLFNYVMEKMKGGGHKILRAFVREKNSQLLGKLGFNKVFEEYQSFEKLL